jgi:hypothetical protein
MAKREEWPERRDGQIRGVDRWEVVMRGVERWAVVVYERDGQMEGVTRLEGWPNWSKEKEPSYEQMAK